ncbi:MAG: sugar transferase [bacterium]
MKRIFDILISIFLLVILSPVFLVVSFAILCAMGRPIYFVQPRPGKNGRVFFLLKFRTMVQTTPSQGVSLCHNHQVTALGKLLRRMSLDEIPQLLNVLRGDMSLIGPRPLLVEYLPLYTAEQNRRHEVRPGITGWAQVNGRNAISWEDKFRLDVWYVDNKTTFLDLKILFLTLLKVLYGSGVNQSDNVSAEKFKGTRNEK